MKEFDKGQPFRWAAHQAEILLPEGSAGALVLDIEPGPGVRWRPFDLEIEGAGRVRIERRSIVKIPVAGNRVVLRALGGGYVIPNELRVLNFRVFSCKVDNAFSGSITVKPKESFLEAYYRRLAGPRPVARIEEDSLPAPVPPEPRPLLHTNASGDCMLMDREHWMALRGYAEFDMYSMNLDSLACWAAHRAGVREEVLEDPLRIYHIEHGTGSGWTPEGEKRLFGRLDKIGLPRLEYPKMLELAQGEMKFNGEDWGHASEDLPEAMMQVPAPVHRT
jgi:hypothetical protein